MNVLVCTYKYSLSQFELLPSVLIISLTNCFMETLVAFNNIVIYVFHFNLTAILCISVLTVTYINLLLTYLLTYISKTLYSNYNSTGSMFRMVVNNRSRPILLSHVNKIRLTTAIPRALRLINIGSIAYRLNISFIDTLFISTPTP